MKSPIEGIQSLSSAQYARARQNAIDRVRSSTTEPDKAYYTARSFSRYPPALTRLLLLALFVVAGLSFLISAGKEIAASDLVLQPIVKDYQKLSPAWADISNVSILFLGELGTLLFTSVTSFFPDKDNRRSIIFRLGAMLCAFIAILANATISIIHYPNMRDSGVTLFGAFITLVPPLIVVFVGLFLERLLVTILEARAQAADAYNKAYDAYQNAQRQPEKDVHFPSLLYQSIYEALVRAGGNNKALILAAVEETPGLQAELVRWQLELHDWSNQSLEVRPTTAPLTAGPEISGPFLTMPALNGSRPH